MTSASGSGPDLALGLGLGLGLGLPAVGALGYASWIELGTAKAVASTSTPPSSAPTGAAGSTSAELTVVSQT